jgi:hypothetical protein
MISFIKSHLNKPDDAFNKGHVKDDIMMNLFVVDCVETGDFDKASNKCHSH